jgi:hypothetical protein
MDYNQQKQRALESLQNQRGPVSQLAGYAPSEDEIVSEIERLGAQDQAIASTKARKEAEQAEAQKKLNEINSAVAKAPDLQARAATSLADRGNNSYVAPSPDRLLSEMERIKASDLQREQEAQKQSEAEFDKNLDLAYRRKALGWASNMEPGLAEYAQQLFPELALINPKSDVQIPYAPVEPQQQTEAIQPVKAPEAPQPQIKTSEVAPKTSNVPSQSPEVMQSVEQSQQPAPAEKSNIHQLMDQANEAEKQARMDKSIARFRNAIIGAGLGKQYQGDLSTYDEQIKASKKPLEDLVLKQELELSESKNDPNSSISQLTKKTLQELGVSMQGLENVSYAQLEKLYPSLTQALYNKMAAQAKQEEAQATKILAQQRLEEARQDKTDKKKEAAYGDLYKKTKSVTDSDAFSLYKQALGAKNQIDSALASWNQSGEDYKIKTSAAFMNYAKTAQQDKSVVRESDMKVLSGGINYGNLGSLIGKFSAKTSGSAFSPQELKAFKAVMDTIANIKRAEIKQNLNPILKKANEKQVDLDLLLDQSVYDDLYNQPLSPQEQMAQIEKKLQANQARIDELKNKQKK